MWLCGMSVRVVPGCCIGCDIGLHPFDSNVIKQPAVVVLTLALSRINGNGWKLYIMMAQRTKDAATDRQCRNVA